MKEKIKYHHQKLAPLSPRINSKNQASKIFEAIKIQQEAENVQLKDVSGILKASVNEIQEEEEKKNILINKLESPVITDRYKNALKAADEKLDQLNMKHLCYLFKYMFLPFLMIISNLFTIIDLIAFNYYDQEILDPRHFNFFFRMDLFVGIMVIIECLYKNFFNASQSVTTKNKILDVINIIEIFWFQTGKNKSNILIFMRAFRSFRMKSIRKYFLLLKFYLKKLVAIRQDDEMYNSIVDFKDDKFHSFLVDSLIDFASGILIQSSFILAMDQIYNYNSFYQDNQNEHLTFVGAAYFVTISFSTIGYGDIFPCITESRLAISLLLVINITIMSNFLTQFIEYLYEVSLYEKFYDFSGHVVIVGHIPEAYFGRFLSELIELDSIQRVLGQETSKDGIKVILVGKDEPSSEIQNLTIYYSENAMFNNEVVYLKADIFSENINWYKQANLKNCRALFAFSQRVTDRPHQDDMELALITRQIKQFFPQLPCYLVLQSQYKEVLVRDTLFDQINIISTTECNESILGFSVENVGFSTMLQHLISIRNKQVPYSIKHETQFDPFQKQYLKDMEQEIYTIPLGPQFYGMTFQELAKLFYFSGFDFAEKQDVFGGTDDQKEPETLATLIAIQTKCEVESNNPVKSRKSLSKLYLEDHLKEKRKILINPQGYIIKQGDIAYIICDDFNEAVECKNITKNSDYFKQYENNIRQLSDINYRQKNQQILQSWWKQEKQRKQEESKISLDSAESVIINDESQRKSSAKTENQPKATIKRIYNFHFLEYPEIQLKNHIVVIGTLQSFARMVHKLHDNADNQKVIVLFTEEKLDLFIWNKLCEDYKYLFFFNGDFHNVNHLMQLSLPRSYQTLILSSANDSLFQDSSAISLARMIQNYFDQSNLLVELKDDRRIFYFTKNPIFASINESVTPFIWPAFQQGSIHLSSCLYGLLARSIYDQNWFQFLEQLIDDTNDESKNCNQKIGCYKVNEEIANYCNYYGVLQYLLLENTPSVIGLALIKFQLTSKYKKTLLEKVMTQSSMHSQKPKQNLTSSILPLGSFYQNTFGNDQVFNSSQQYLAVANKLFGNRFVLTNPTFYTPLEEGDIVLVLGEINQEKINQMVQIQQRRRTIHSIQASATKSRVSPLQSPAQKQNCESFENLRKDMYFSPLQAHKKADNQRRLISNETTLKLKNIPELSDFGLESFIYNQQYETLLEQNVFMQSIYESINSSSSQFIKKRTMTMRMDSPYLQKNLSPIHESDITSKEIINIPKKQQNDQQKYGQIKSLRGFQNLQKKQIFKNLLISHLNEKIDFQKKISQYNEYFQTENN